MNAFDLIKRNRKTVAEIEKKDAQRIAEEKEAKKVKKSYSPFDFINSIYDKNYILDDDNVNQYNIFVVNMGISQSISGIIPAFRASCLSTLLGDLPKETMHKMVYDYLYYQVPKGKPKFTKWAKVEKMQHLDLIQTVYKVNREKAIEICNRLSVIDIAMIEDWVKSSKGGLIDD